MTPVIETRNITKYYKGFPAVDNVSLRIHQGEVYGFIGLNGAGKTTTIRMLLGMIRPSEGACYLNGIAVSGNHRARGNISGDRPNGKMHREASQDIGGEHVDEKVSEEQLASSYNSSAHIDGKIHRSASQNITRKHPDKEVHRLASAEVAESNTGEKMHQHTNWDIDYEHSGGNRIDNTPHTIWNRVGSLVETPSAYPELTVRENLDVFRRLRFLSERHSVSRVINRLRLRRYADIKAKHLSLGNLQRLGIAKALLHKPDILLLDEPTNGLDPAGMAEIRGLLEDLAKNHRVTIFISSHLLDEVSKIVTKVGIIHEGRMLQEMDAAELATLRKQRLVFGTRDNRSAAGILEAAGYKNLFKEETLVVTDDEWAVRRPEEVSRMLAEQGLAPWRISVEEEDLEAYFLRVIEEEGGLL